MIWGLVFAFLEGRHTSEVLAMVLSASCISASGVVKGVGQYTIEQWGVTEYSMPAVGRGAASMSLTTLPAMAICAPRTTLPSGPSTPLRPRRSR
ncbi:MAG: DUF5690 family protein [Planctomycetota bacterium]